MTLLWPAKAHSHTTALNHTITENGGWYCKDDKWESSLSFFFFFFWAVCALNVTSLWFTGVGQIVLLWFRSAKCCLPVAQQRVPNKLGALLRVCAAKLIYWQGHVYVTAAHGVSMTEDIWMLPHHLEVWNFQLLCFITSFSTFFLQTCKKKKKITSSAITPSTPLFFLASITGLLQQIRVTLKLSHTH